MNGPIFQNRREAGELLARELAGRVGRGSALVLGLPRGGVPVAVEVATRLRLPMDVFVVRKLGLPGHEEFAMGAIASGGVRVLNAALIEQLGVSDAVVDNVSAREGEELARRERVYRGHHPPPELRGKTIVLVDDGVATGSTMFAAIESLRKHRVAKVIVAVPVAPDTTRRELEWASDDVVVLASPESFISVGQFYRDFSQTTDEEVRRLLRETRGTEERGEGSRRLTVASPR